MIPHPDFLGGQYAARFQDQSVVDRYHLRPEYPTETFLFLEKLIEDEPRVLLDAGCGPGNIARNMLDYVKHIDAVDISAPMLAQARSLPRGDDSSIRWLHGRIEEVELEPPYALITTGDSLHWMDWGVVLPRFAQLLTPHGSLAIVNVDHPVMPWQAGYIEIVSRFSNNPTYQPLDLIVELEKYGLFQKQGEFTTQPILWQQSIDDYIEAQHARSGLSLETMTEAQATRFHTEMQALLDPFALNGVLTIQIAGHIVWGKPLPIPTQPA